MKHAAPYPPTERQRQLLMYIWGFQCAKGYSPSFREMAAALNTNTSRIADIMFRLTDRGQIRTLVQRWRAIEVLHPPLIPYDHHGRPVYFVRVP